MMKQKAQEKKKSMPPSMMHGKDKKKEMPAHKEKDKKKGSY
jgi:hypothetical protein